jgi:putative transcriptional regulator
MAKFKLNQWLDFFNLSQKDLSDGTGINKNTINRYCNNTFDKITREHIDLICSFFKCSPNDIFEVNNTLKINYPSPMIENMIESYKVMEKLSPEQVDNIVTDSVDNNFSYVTTNNEPIFNFINLEEQEAKIEIQKTIETNLENIINIILNNTDIKNLSHATYSIVEEYTNSMRMYPMQIKFQHICDTLAFIIGVQYKSTKLLKFIVAIKNIYLKGGFIILSDNDLMDISTQSITILDELKNYIASKKD